MKHYRKHSGHIQIAPQVYQVAYKTGNVQYLEGGVWKDIDPTLKDRGANSYGLDTAPYQVEFPKKAHHEIQYQHQQHGISLVCEGVSSVDGVLTDSNTMTYTDAYGQGVHLILKATKNKILKFIKIDSPPSGTDDIEFRFAINASNIDEMSVGKDKGKLADVKIKEYQGKKIGLIQDENNGLYFRPAQVWDAGRENIQDIPFTVDYVNGILYLTKRIPRALLNSLVYPIYTDLTAQYESEDACEGHVRVTGDWNYCYSSTIGDSLDTYLDCRSGSPHTSEPEHRFYRAFFVFDTTDLHLSTNILSGNFKAYSHIGGSMTHRLVKTFQAQSTALTENDYNNCGYDAGYEQAGRANQAPAVAGCDTDQTVTGDAWYTWALNSTGIGWVEIDQITNTHLGLRHYNDAVNEHDNGTSNYNTWYLSDTASYEPELNLTYTIETDVTGTGGAKVGGNSTYTIQFPYRGTGGAKVGGTAAILRPVSWTTAAEFSLTADIKAVSGYSVTSGGEDSDFPVSHALDITRPHKKFRSTTTANTTIKMTWKDAIDTLVLYNVNFRWFTFYVTAGESCVIIQDKMTGLYHGIVRIDPDGDPESYAPDTNTAEIRIPLAAMGNTPYDGESYFSIGAIIGGKRKVLSYPPRKPYRKQMVENVHERRFDGGNREVERAGTPYLMCEYVWDTISTTHFDELAEVENHLNVSQPCVIHEKWSDYEFICLAQKVNDLDYARRKDMMRTGMNFRELV